MYALVVSSVLDSLELFENRWLGRVVLVLWIHSAVSSSHHRESCARHAHRNHMPPTDPNAALLAGAQRVAVDGLHARALPLKPPRLPMIREQRGSEPVVCAAYRATCIAGSLPPRASLSLATGGQSGLGLGMPVRTTSAAPSAGWRLRAKDFCKGPPRELLHVGCCNKRDGTVPIAEHCFCPTYSLSPRSADPMDFPRWVPAGARPSVPRLPYEPRCDASRSFVSYQCSRRLLLPPPPTASQRPGRDGVVDVLLATSDHFGHGVFAMVQRILNQIHLARRHRLEPAVFIGERTFMEPQACEYGTNPYHFAPAGDNVWEYWFEQPGNYSLGQTQVNGRRVRQLQVTTVETSAEFPVRSYGPLETRARSRAAAHALLGDGGERLVKQAIRDEASHTFARWRGERSCA
jgi:hypothetical protein